MTEAIETMFGTPRTAGAVRDTSELARVLQIPRRDPAIGEVVAAPLTARLKTERGHMSLWPAQALILIECHDFRGAVGILSVGTGKTLVSFLLPVVLGAARPLLLVPGKLVSKTRAEFDALAYHWRAPSNLRIMSYSYLSRHPEALDAIAPDLIVADESHKLKSKKAACTKRVARYFVYNPECVFVPMSGTMANRSFLEYWHLIQWALPAPLQPLPFTYSEVEVWAEALDEKIRIRRPLGALARFGPTVDAARQAYGDLLKYTPGVVSVRDGDVDASLTIDLITWRVPEIDDALATLRKTWSTPGGEEFCEAFDLWRHARELANGFYYRWEIEPPAAWLEARRVFNAFVRHTLRYSRTLDSAAQVVEAFASDPAVVNWKAIEHAFDLRTVPVWISNAVVEWAAAWIASAGAGLVWVEHVAAGYRLEAATGVPYFRRHGETDTGRSIMNHTGPAIVSVASVSEGFNLQRYARNLVLNAPPTGKQWEQMIGRSHRVGQRADVVEFDILITAKEQRDGFDQARADAYYTEQTTGQKQKLCLADIVERQAA